MTNTVVLSQHDGVATVRLDRPQTLNSLTAEVFADLIAAGLALRGDDSVKAVVLCGEGRAFSSGLDMSEISRMVDGTGEEILVSRERLGAARALAQQAVHVWQLVEAPVIAAMQGVAYGGGIQIALGADIRIAAPTTRISFMEINWGIIPDMCATQLLPALVGPARAKELILTGRVFSGEQALSYGVVEEVHEDPVARAHELAAQLATKSGRALRQAKELIDLAAHVPLSEGLDAEQRVVASLIGGEEQRQAVAARHAELRRESRS